jgi:hypothetical protein
LLTEALLTEASLKKEFLKKEFLKKRCSQRCVKTLRQNVASKRVLASKCGTQSKAKNALL